MSVAGVVRKAVVVAAAGLVGSWTVVPAPAGAQPNVIVAVSATYAPAEVVIVAGTGLTLVNLDADTHDVTAVHGEFSSATIGRGERAKVVGVESLEPNTYSFFCTVHPDMFGNLTVVG